MKFTNIAGLYPASRGAVGGAVNRSVRGMQHMKRYHVPRPQLAVPFAVANQATIWAQYFMQQWLLQPVGGGTFWEAFLELYGLGKYTAQPDGPSIFTPSDAAGLRQVTKGCASFLTLGLEPDPTIAYSPPFGDGVTGPLWLNTTFYNTYGDGNPLWYTHGFGVGLDAFDMTNLFAYDYDGTTPLQVVLYAADAVPQGFIWIENYPAKMDPPEPPTVGALINNNAPATKIVFAGVPPAPPVTIWNVRDYWQAAYPNSVGPLYFFDFPTVYFAGYYVSTLCGLGPRNPQTNPASYDTFFAGSEAQYQANLIFDNTTITPYFHRNAGQKLAASIVAKTYPVPLPGSAEHAGWVSRSSARSAQFAGRNLWPGAPPHR